MNAKLLIIAILTAVILALYMTVSAPATEGEPDIRVTLGGDCSADRATGDLYHPVDPYCIVAEGPAGGSMAPNGPGAGYNGKQADDTSNREADEPGRKEPGGGSGTGDGPEDPAILVNPPAVEPEDPPTPHIEVRPPTGPHDGPGDDDKDQPKNDPTEPKDQKKDEGSKDKQCKKDGRDNVNSQGNHDCSADRPDPHSGQERTSDHGQGNGSNEQAVNQAKHQDNEQKSPDKECKKADRDNANSQGNHDCSADHPDTNSDQQLTSDHGPADQAPGNDQGKKKGKKD